MKSTGVIRRIDELGRIVIPKEIRRVLGIRDGENLEIYTENESIILKKYNRMNSINELAPKIVELVNSSFNYQIIITDREKVVASSLKEIFKDSLIPKEYLTIMENREIVTQEKTSLTLNNVELSGNFLFIPIISLNDSIGLIIMYNQETLTNELSIGKFLANLFISKLDI